VKKIFILPFAWKLWIAMTLLSVGLTAVGVYTFYMMAYSQTISQLGKNLRDVGSLGSLLFDNESREAIKRLKTITEQESIVSQKDMASLEPGATLSSLAPETIKRLHNSEDFTLLREKLRMIDYASYFPVGPLRESYEIENPKELLSKGMIGAYLVVGVKDSPDNRIMMFLVSSLPEPTADGWPGNPIGNLYRSLVPLDYATAGETYVCDQLLEDEFYQCLYVSIPLFDENGQVFAYLSLDYAAGRELEKLNRLKLICFSLVAVSFCVALLSSFLFSQWLNKPLRSLHNVAVKVGNHDYNVAVTIKNKDELGVLAKVFNQMVVNIRTSAQALKLKNDQLVSVVSDMHDGVGSILTGIVMASQKGACDENNPLANYGAINRLASLGLVDIRFLMGVLDAVQAKDQASQPYTFETIIDELRFLAADILTPYKIAFDVLAEGDVSDQAIDFQTLFDLQRIFREAFANIIKHSGAKRCRITLSFAQPALIISIHDDGNGLQGDRKTHGRGLNSIGQRVARLGGRLEYSFTNGCTLQIHLPKMIPEPKS
jgi:HAMP domain-containing protein